MILATYTNTFLFFKDYVKKQKSFGNGFLTMFIFKFL